MNTSFKIILIATLATLLLNACAGDQQLVAEKQSTIDSLQQVVTGMKRQLEGNKDLQTELDALKKTAAERDAELQQALKELSEIKELQVVENRTLITNDLLFRTGSFQITEEGKRILQEIWKVLKKYPNREILIVGHTDDLPIAKEHVGVYRSNWDLSTWRALAVLHYLRYHTDAPEENLRVMGAGAFQPVVANDSPEGRRQNRRVEIIVGARLDS